MKKSLIAAGAASVALAAMPIVGAFAVGNNGTLTDRIQTTIGDTCKFVRGADATLPSPAASSHPSGTWTTDTTDNTIDILTAQTITLNSETALGSSLFTVICNDVDGYQVTATTPDLVKPATATEAAAQMDYLDSATGAAGKWRFSSNGTGATIGNGSGGDIALKETATTTGTDFTVTYYAYPGASQAAGTYSADVVYTFAQL